MADELSSGDTVRIVKDLREELRESISGIHDRLDRVVSMDVYTVQSSFHDQQIAALSQSLQKERDEREAFERNSERHRLEEVNRRDRDRQARLYNAVIPIVVCLISSAVALWAAIK
ncbi:hypothetical protein [Streptomyces albireticuli]|uniref:hypothetical protein n=1 Tax=Streptomyces albireticuli TaxID=1940 RepID=UPI00117D0EB5|nr:hypothetical protein [Streptomyces albireticuli]MCD9146104.1 hypothetical protein [Streptomyces albireticuli]MCD9166280.1 hypothetical protein [Streptomyces albireticuli]MCD9196603.1 hypothetical protein [Streptomyces albireticuli]